MGSVQPPSSSAASTPGVFTKTLIRSPVCKFILHARIRHHDFNDVVFVGEDFIHVKQIKNNGHLEHIATKDDFGATIRAAKTFTLDQDPPEYGDDFIKTEQPDGNATTAGSGTPPQLVVLTLGSDDMVFLYLKDNGDGDMEFVHQACPMPTFDDPIYQTGAHLAVDPASRALAVAANEREIVLYSAKPTEEIRRQLEVDDPEWYPIAKQRALPVTGVIQHLEFLHPPGKDIDHIILLVILIDQRRTKAIWIDWYGNSDLIHAQTHPPQPIDTARTPSNLLVPLRDAAFLMITGTELKLQRDILSGSMRSSTLTPHVDETTSPGSSSRRPVWASWCRPLRTRTSKQNADIFYLVREDGIVILVEVSNAGSINLSHAGDLRCHVGSAFASLGDPSDPDILAVVGDMSNGRVVHFGSWPSPGRVADTMSRVDTMNAQDCETLPNWASSIDMIVSKLPQTNSRSSRTTDAVFITAGREPYGTITELRKGLEARVAYYFDLEGFRSTEGAWVLPNVSTASILILLSTPSSTRLLDISPDLSELTELDETDTTVMALDQRTLVANVLNNGHLLQIAERSICASANIAANFEDRSRRDSGEGCTIIAAAIEPSRNCAVVIERGAKNSELLAFKHNVLRPDQESESEDELEGLQQIGETAILAEEPLCLATCVHEKRVVGLFATVEGNLQLFTVDIRSKAVILHGSLKIVDDRQSLCDRAVLLQPKASGTAPPSKLLAVCGLRDGRVMTVEIDVADEPSFEGTHSMNFGSESVRLFRQADETQKAYAFIGLDTCVLTWDGASPQSLDVKSLWLSDRSRPELPQGPVTTVSLMPSIDYLSGTDTVGLLAEHLVIVSSSEISIASVDEAAATVPRQIKVTGTPNRVVYAEQQRSLICASMCTGVRSFPSNMRNAPPEERRQIWPVIDFIPDSMDHVSFTFDLQPGERVYALLEWSFLKDNKNYSHIMVAGSHTRPNGTSKGRIAFLKPTLRNWEIVDATEATRSITYDDPVYALALFDDVTFVACAGCHVVSQRFDKESRRWNELCAPLRLAGIGSAVSVDGPLVYVSVAGEGLVTLRLEHSLSRDEDGSHPYRLTLVAHAPRIDHPLSHTIVPIPTTSSTTTDQTPQSQTPQSQTTNIALLATKHSLLLGLSSPSPQERTHRTRLLFSSHLPHSLSRLRQASTRPLWRPAPPEGVLADGIVGLATDGSLTGVTVLDEKLWRRLSWLQRVLEWDAGGEPHALADDPELLGGRERALPIGFGGGGDAEIGVLGEEGVADRHVDGDVLARVLMRGGVERLEGAVRRLAGREGRVGEWVRENLEQEIEGVRGVVENVGGLVGGWL